MEGEISLAIIGGVIFLFALGFSVWIRAEADEARMQGVQKEIDGQAASARQNIQIQTLTREFKIESELIAELYSSQIGWGELTVELAMAQHLAHTDPKTYPDFIAALKKIGSLRGRRMNWNKIAKNLGFKLGPAISAAEHARNELRREARADQLPVFTKPETVNI
ncbi:MAG: hypothetical protein HY081_10020 [Gammaproteobacteria bacterium]|nr:hypothetical protein [Gammaproteobacteria bacterium]